MPLNRLRTHLSHLICSPLKHHSSVEAATTAHDLCLYTKRNPSVLIADSIILHSKARLVANASLRTLHTSPS
ncbi:hypothetical protein AMATHDRAFT_65997 [Amanita thiersii Skay4041]|uniref:Uncharacterized protein n=1 Tax=Amanita thiersii Skay4041 TaxID=703135 RepID=A0A2A9NJ19_9AGAR|nr:hypothetical protein AMATHDRAFT_65997 [Amanita thiersii Skay4041]